MQVRILSAGLMNHIDLYIHFTNRFSHEHRSGAKKGIFMRRKDRHDDRD